MVVLIASSLSLVRPGNSLTVDSSEGPFLAAGEETEIHVVFESATPINVVGGTVLIPTEYVEVTEVSNETSLIDLWTEGPVLSDDGSRLRFSGGLVSPEGVSGSGQVLAFKVRTLQAGKAELRLVESELLAHDGRGTNVLGETRPITLNIRESNTPSPDVNHDRRISIIDIGLVSSRLFRAYESQYDLNNDGKISISDLSILVAALLSAK
jgi:hypothetical protein